MAEAGRVVRPDAADRGEPTAAAPQVPPVRGLLDGVDELLDEIDGVLEGNAEEFVRGYVQKGGE